MGFIHLFYPVYVSVVTENDIQYHIFSTRGAIEPKGELKVWVIYIHRVLWVSLGSKEMTEFL